MSASTLSELLKRRGGVFADEERTFGGPLHFGSPADEYFAATKKAAVIDLSNFASLEIRGADRVKFLQGFCTNDVRRLAVGQGCEAFITNVKGKLVGHVWIRAADSVLRLNTLAASAEQIVPHLERYVINEDVAIADRSTESGELLIVGPEAAERLKALRIEVTDLGNLDEREIKIVGSAGTIRRFDVAPHTAYALALPRARLPELWTALCDADVQPAGEQVWTALRIEAGLPIYGIDIADDNLAQEVGRTKTAISFTKGCYLGQEPIARIDAMGHVNRELCRLRLSNPDVPFRGATVWADAAGTQVVGSVSSAAFSYGRQTAVAMAVLRAAFAAPGADAFIEFEKTRSPAAIF